MIYSTLKDFSIKWLINLRLHCHFYPSTMSDYENPFLIDEHLSQGHNRHFDMTRHSPVF